MVVDSDHYDVVAFIYTLMSAMLLMLFSPSLMLLFYCFAADMRQRHLRLPFFPLYRHFFPFFSRFLHYAA